MLDLGDIPVVGDFLGGLGRQVRSPMDRNVESAARGQETRDYQRDQPIVGEVNREERAKDWTGDFGRYMEKSFFDQSMAGLGAHASASGRLDAAMSRGATLQEALGVSGGGSGGAGGGSVLGNGPQRAAAEGARAVSHESALERAHQSSEREKDRAHALEMQRIEHGQQGGLQDDAQAHALEMQSNVLSQDWRKFSANHDQLEAFKNADLKQAHDFFVNTQKHRYNEYLLDVDKAQLETAKHNLDLWVKTMEQARAEEAHERAGEVHAEGLYRKAYQTFQTIVSALGPAASAFLGSVLGRRVGGFSPRVAGGPMATAGGRTIGNAGWSRASGPLSSPGARRAPGGITGPSTQGGLPYYGPGYAP